VAFSVRSSLMNPYVVVSFLEIVCDFSFLKFIDKLSLQSSSFGDISFIHKGQIS
jgi:hypothetical protein